MTGGEFKAGAASYGRPRPTAPRPTARRPRVQYEPVPDRCRECGRDMHRDNPPANCSTCNQEVPR